MSERYDELPDDVEELEEMQSDLKSQARKLRLKCVGAQSAAQLMVTVGDNPERHRSEASFAMLCGVAPCPCPRG